MKTFLRLSICLLSAIISLTSCANILVTLGLEPAKKVYPKEYDDSFSDTTIVINGVRLFAYYSPASAGKCADTSNAAKTAIVIHGYKSRPYNLRGIGTMYRDSLGYNVLLPALRHHDHSEGNHIQMGWLDRLDILEWSKVAHEMFGDTLQVIHGVSMGAATTMMVSGEKTGDYVRGFVEDCGYTTVWDQVSRFLTYELKWKEQPKLTNIDKVCKKRYGWSTREASSLDQLAKCYKPMLFIHGGADDFVPTKMVYENYDAKVNGYKELWIAPDSKHAVAFEDHPAEYTAVVRKFLHDHVE